MEVEANFVCRLNLGTKFKCIKPYAKFKYNVSYKTVGFGVQTSGEIRRHTLIIESIPQNSVGYEYQRFSVFKKTAQTLHDEGFLVPF